MQPLHTKDRDAIVQEFLDYIIGFVEQPRPELGDLPVCPFSRGARLEGRMRIEVIELNVEAITAQLPCFQRDPHLEMLLCVHPHRGPPSCAEVYDLAKELNRSLLALNLVALAGHPSDPFNIDGLYTRRDPFPNIQLLRHDVGERAYKSLEKTTYYDRWSEENYRNLIPVAPG